MALEALNLGELASSGSGPTDAANSASNLQNKFMETLKYRIDARIVKNLKGRKAMKLSDLIELVIGDLQMQIQLPQNADQLEARRSEITKRIDDLVARVYLKKEGDLVEYVPV